MLQTIGVMVGAYIFTRMFTAGIRNYPNDDKFANVIIRLLSIITALFAAGCVAWLLIGPTVNAEILRRP